MPEEAHSGLLSANEESLSCPRLRREVVDGEGVHKCVVERLCSQSILQLQDLSTRGHIRLDGSVLAINSCARDDSETIIRNLSFEGERKEARTLVKSMFSLYL